eukprot:PhM_4_TR4606/c0_g2_i1/m.39157/K15335/NSUN2; tRNA (cytosine34-C5)-methyltransferase
MGKPNEVDNVVPTTTTAAVDGNKEKKYQHEREERLQKRRAVKDGEISDEFVAKYKALLHERMGDAEWNRFIESLRTPLPMTLRVTQQHPAAEVVRRILLEHGALQPVGCLPRGMAYGCDDGTFNSTADTAVRELCGALHASGFVTFQETVSMIPPVCLTAAMAMTTPTAAVPESGLVPFPLILDMCAAPGSKTLQVLDAFPDTWKGAVLSNEKDRIKATQLLPARLKRSRSPCTFSIQGDARRFPFLYSDELEAYLLFDGIVCDVPCSGDGTSRKDSSVQQTFAPDHGDKLHPTQVDILKRGLLMLKDQGVMMYSTCSLNPAENERVVEEALERLNTHLHADVIDLQSLVPDLRLGHGLVDTTLPHVARVLPHHNNTGGFFVVGLRKVWERVPETPRDRRLPPVTADRWSHWSGLKRYRALTADEVSFLRDFYGFDVDKVSQETGLHFVMHGTETGKPKRVIALSEGAYQLLYARVHRAASECIATAGVRLFQYLDHATNVLWRCTHEGAQIAAPHSDGRRVVAISVAAFEELLRNGTLPNERLAELGVPMASPFGPVWLRVEVHGVTLWFSAVQCSNRMDHTIEVAVAKGTLELLLRGKSY